MPTFTRIADHERPVTLRLALYGVVFVLAFLFVAALLEELGWNTNMDFGATPEFSRRLLIGLLALILPAVVLLPDLGFCLDYDAPGRRLRVTRLFLFWTRPKEWDLASWKGLRARRKIKALRVVYDVELRGEGSEGPYLFSLTERAVEENRLLESLAARLDLPFEVLP